MTQPTPQPLPQQLPQPLPQPLPQSSGIRCIRCGYDLSGTAIGGYCPECGNPVSQQLSLGQLPNSGKAVAALVLGIVSIPACILYGITAIICGILALIFANLAKKDMDAGRVNPQSRGLARAGNICGIIGLILGIAVVLFFAGVFIWASYQPLYTHHQPPLSPQPYPVQPSPTPFP